MDHSVQWIYIPETELFTFYDDRRAGCVLESSGETEVLN